ncbi:P1 family peptidase [Cohaesibacter intestini]|uniref:DmpA family aminopeptidase n=1 Tax=Cohaesibacter intestini TaxID=2211145 RepID=UPI000DE86EB5|nr:P1 family peptidase [Cohaesibacter intestini]
MSERNAADFGIRIGTMTPGPSNSMADIAGLSFGHVTLSNGAVQTGVSVIHPHGGSLFEEKCVAAAHVINGFGKSVGLMQLTELGQLETPIVLTNTLSVGTASTALVRHMLADHPAIGEATGTVNPLVMECNDGAYLNDIRGLHVTQDHVADALVQRLSHCQHGAIGAGTGMSAYELKGGIGSASRLVPAGPHSYRLAALTLCNMGLLCDLVVDGQPVGRTLERQQGADEEKGSIIIILATDAPLTARQLQRLCVRASAGLARTGTQFGSGSGDIVLAFTTANRIPHDMPQDPVERVEHLHENALDPFFRATIEATEEAILTAMFAAERTEGKHGRCRESLADLWPSLPLKKD